ncbi:hypothetical protein [Arthrobacter celericrescens]|uniref:hypothetical protein n=1 Tax=Arthrobacter celericrescens TaxID=2320851 RepID=UPI000EA3D7F1|nr:hypothetical protein [Arthrobacter celericrescens]
MTHSAEMYREMPWPFPNNQFPDGLGAVVMRTVLSGERPALQVLHDPDNGWAIADGVDDPNVPGGCVATHISHVVKLDPTLAALAAMPPGTLADRLETGAEWQFSDFKWEDE